MNIKFTILTFLFTQIFYSQVKIKENNLTIEYKKVKKASQSIGQLTNVKTKSKDVVQYNIKVRVEMLDNKKRSFDANKFSLINYKDSLRLRPIDVTYTNFTDKWHFIKLIKNKPRYNSLEKRYKPDIKDTFLDYEFEGINNLIIPICYQAYDEKHFRLKIPDKECHESYFEPKDLRKRNVNLFFPMLKSVKSVTLYYGNKKITEIELK